MRLLHAIHDFLPRHRAGSEIYATRLCTELARRHFVWVLAAEYDLGRRHGSFTWRLHDGLPVIEIVNNWRCASFDETYRSPHITRQLGHALRATRPDVLHLHSLLNLSMDLPEVARARGIAVVATLHDHTLVCPAGGQRLHVADAHVCDTIDPERCARCFRESPFHAQMLLGRVPVTGAARQVARLVRWVSDRFPRALTVARERAAHASVRAVTPSDIVARLAYARRVFDTVDLFVAPSRSIGDAFLALGVPSRKLRVADYGFRPLAAAARPRHDGVLRIGFVGTLVWHKGAHVLLDAARLLPRDRYQLTLFGALDTFPDYVSQLRRLAGDLPIRFAGGFSDEHAADVYSQMDVLVVPSLWPENSPLVMHEAFMSGVPVVGAHTGGIPELVEHGVNGLLYTPSSVAELAAALRSLIDDPALIDRLRARLPQVRSIEEDAAWWEQTYDEVVQAHSAHPRIPVPPPSASPLSPSVGDRRQLATDPGAQIPAPSTSAPGGR